MSASPFACRSGCIRGPLVTAGAIASLATASAHPPLAAGPAMPAAAAAPDNSPDPWGEPDEHKPRRAPQPVIQLAILLDTSGSMNGLINQARARIWDVVNDLAKARRDGQRPRLEVALYQYGSDQLPSSEGFLTLVQPFTSDLDLLSERLFSLRVSGSSEYCGWTLRSAMNELSWDRTPLSVPMHQQPLRVIVIAGNEPFTQGPIDYQRPARDACQRGVIVNTVYCGDFNDGQRTGWYAAAQIGQGAYLAIDQDAPIARVRCPQDDEIIRLNTRLNETYIPYGPRGEASKDRQVAQDEANRELSREALVGRAAAKATKQYANEQWDLVDAVEAKKVDLETAPTESLPATMAPMTVDQRKDEVARLKTERDGLRERIRALAAERERHLADLRGRHPHPAAGETLDAAMIRAIREQARRLGFTFEPD